jgi:hypothetical protein
LASSVRYTRPARYEAGASYVDELPEGWRPFDRFGVADAFRP